MSAACLWLSGFRRRERSERGERSEPCERSGSEARKTRNNGNPDATGVFGTRYFVACLRFPASVRLRLSVVVPLFFFVCWWFEARQGLGEVSPTRVKAAQLETRFPFLIQAGFEISLLSRTRV